MQPERMRTAEEAKDIRDNRDNRLERCIVEISVVFLNQTLATLLLTGVYFLFDRKFTDAFLVTALLVEVITLLVFFCFCCNPCAGPDDYDPIVNSVVGWAIIGWQTTIVACACVRFYAIDGNHDPFIAVVVLLLFGDCIFIICTVVIHCVVVRCSSPAHLEPQPNTQTPTMATAFLPVASFVNSTVTVAPAA